jgi:hypothetical protein
MIESLLYWLFFTAAWTVLAEARPDAEAMPGRFENLQSILAAAADGGYQVERTLALLNR